MKTPVINGRQRRAWHWLTPMMALAWAAGCSDGVTSMVLVVNSDLARGEIDRVTFSVKGPGVDPARHMATVDLNIKDFPLTLALIHGGAALGPLEATVEGWYGAETSPRGRASKSEMHFKPGRTIREQMLLRRIVTVPTKGDASLNSPDSGSASDATVTSDTGSATGTDGGSGRADAGTDSASVQDAAAPVDADAPADVAAPIDAPPRDVAIESAPDGDVQIPPVRDAGTGGCGTGCACQQSCPEGTACRCAAGCGCTLTCQKNKDCDATCTGAGTHCTVNSVDVSTGRVTCSGGATCDVNGSGKTSNLDVACQGGSCVVDCTGDVSNCYLTCSGGAQCLVHCSTANSNCGFRTCDAGLTTCPGGTTKVCNRPCPP